MPKATAPHPPILRALGMKRKIGLRRTARLTFRVLHSMRRLRGTAFDVFGYASLRRTERAMVPEYVAAMRTVAAHLTDANLDEAVAIASLPDRVRGYEHLKAERAAAYRAELASRVEAFIRR